MKKQEGGPFLNLRAPPPQPLHQPILPEFSTTSPFIFREPSAVTYTLPAFMPGKRTLVSPSLPQKTVGDGRPMYTEQILKKVTVARDILTRFLSRIYYIYKGPRFRGFKDFDVLFVFAKFFEFFQDYPLEAISRGFKIPAEAYSGDF